VKFGNNQPGSTEKIEYRIQGVRILNAELQESELPSRITRIVSEFLDENRVAPILTPDSPILCSVLCFMYS
jgi:hypothetical protein